LTVQASLEHPFPALIHSLLFLIRSTSLLDAPVRAIGTFLTTQAHWFGISMKELERLTIELDETEEKELKQQHLRSIATHGSNIRTASAPSSSVSINYSAIVKAIPQPHQQVGYFRRTLSRFFWWISPSAVVSSVVASIGRRTLSKTTTRFLKSLNFLHKTWLYQMAINPDRAKVLLSVVRHCPLIDADHSSAFSHLGDTHVDAAFGLLLEEQRALKKKEVLILYGEDDGLTPKMLLDELRVYMPEAKAKVIPQTDHSMFLQQPQLVFDLIWDFLQQPTPVSRATSPIDITQQPEPIQSNTK